MLQALRGNDVLFPTLVFSFQAVETHSVSSHTGNFLVLSDVTWIDPGHYQDSSSCLNLSLNAVLTKASGIKITQYTISKSTLSNAQGITAILSMPPGLQCLEDTQSLEILNMHMWGGA